MSARPFDVQLVITRLVDAKAAIGLREIRGRADYAQVRSLQDFPAPCGYVLLATETATETKTGQSLPNVQNPLAQVVRVQFGIAMAFRNERGFAGDELRDELLEKVGSVRDRLLGWTPPVAGGRQLQLNGGDLVDYDASTALWIDKWQTQHILKPEISP